MNPETKQCPYCGETILAIAKKCKHCGAFLDESARMDAMPSAEEIKATKLRVQEIDIMDLPLRGGKLTLTTKKIRGKVKATTQLPDGKKVKSVQDIDALLSLVTSTVIVKAKIPKSTICILILCSLVTIVYRSIPALATFSGLVALVSALYILCLCARRVLVINIAGNSFAVLIKNKKEANKFVEAVRKTKAEYELKAGL